MIKVALIGYGKAGQAVAQVLQDDPRYELCWIARRTADEDHIISLRLGGIVGHHEVIFGCPYQTVRLIHNSIELRAFGTGAAFALAELQQCKNGFHTFDDLMMRMVRKELLSAADHWNLRRADAFGPMIPG